MSLYNNFIGIDIGKFRFVVALQGEKQTQEYENTAEAIQFELCRNSTRTHPLKTLIGTILLASLCGIDSFSGFYDFTECHYEELQEHFDFPQY